MLQFYLFLISTASSREAFSSLNMLIDPLPSGCLPVSLIRPFRLWLKSLFHFSGMPEPGKFFRHVPGSKSPAHYRFFLCFPVAILIFRNPPVSWMITPLSGLAMSSFCSSFNSSSVASSLICLVNMVVSTNSMA